MSLDLECVRCVERKTTSTLITGNYSDYLPGVTGQQRVVQTGAIYLSCCQQNDIIKIKYRPAPALQVDLLKRLVH